MSEDNSEVQQKEARATRDNLMLLCEAIPVAVAMTSRANEETKEEPRDGERVPTLSSVDSFSWLSNTYAESAPTSERSSDGSMSARSELSSRLHGLSIMPKSSVSNSVQGIDLMTRGASARSVVEITTPTNATDFEIPSKKRKSDPVKTSKSKLVRKVGAMNIVSSIISSVNGGDIGGLRAAIHNNIAESCKFCVQNISPNTNSGPGAIFSFFAAVLENLPDAYFVVSGERYLSERTMKANFKFKGTLLTSTASSSLFMKPSLVENMPFTTLTPDAVPELVVKEADFRERHIPVELMFQGLISLEFSDKIFDIRKKIPSDLSKRRVRIVGMTLHYFLRSFVDANASIATGLSATEAMQQAIIVQEVDDDDEVDCIDHVMEDGGFSEAHSDSSSTHSIVSSQSSSHFGFEFMPSPRPPV